MTEPDDENLLLFTPVPLARRHARGWSADVQIAFISAMSRSGVVATAARSVGRTPRGAYALRGRRGAEGFAAAWDQAIALGLEALRDTAIEHYHDPPCVPVIRRGRIIGWRVEQNDYLAIAALSAYRAQKVGIRLPHESRMLYRAQVAEADALLGGPAIWPDPASASESGHAPDPPSAASMGVHRAPSIRGL
ncbi:hypothetical protein [Sphingomonas cavernae]|uniref:Uncharacterized protein n=1 Tax=Sphingomonas cavernae TaxID=2320861 RepID=A0A418WPM9_9SPHN|nr:hypothetical protein [Sphingomonas cavernae]RJF93185.1 hypothetical protein D3876_02150 [Sphingomonas cavernae]